MFKEDDDAQDPVYDLLLAVALLDLGLYSRQKLGILEQ
jgi:hypothetical protein